MPLLKDLEAEFKAYESEAGVDFSRDAGEIEEGIFAIEDSDEKDKKLQIWKDYLEVLKSYQDNVAVPLAEIGDCP